MLFLKERFELDGGTLPFGLVFTPSIIEGESGEFEEGFVGFFSFDLVFEETFEEPSSSFWSRRLIVKGNYCILKRYWIANLRLASLTVVFTLSLDWAYSFSTLL